MGSRHLVVGELTGRVSGLVLLAVLAGGCSSISVGAVVSPSAMLSSAAPSELLTPPPPTPGEVIRGGPLSLAAIQLLNPSVGFVRRGLALVPHWQGRPTAD